MNRTTRILAVALLAAVLVLPLAAAHPRAIVVDQHERCYIYTNEAENEFWIESNGVTTGGVEGGTPADHVTGATGAGSGLQRGSGPWGPADTRVDQIEWTEHCVL